MRTFACVGGLLIIISPYLTISPASKTPAMADANKLSYHDFPIPKPRTSTIKSVRNESNTKTVIVSVRYLFRMRNREQETKRKHIR